MIWKKKREKKEKNNKKSVLLHYKDFIMVVISYLVTL